jgi:hypothetical protein
VTPERRSAARSRPPDEVHDGSRPERLFSAHDGSSIAPSASRAARRTSPPSASATTRPARRGWKRSAASRRSIRAACQPPCPAAVPAIDRARDAQERLASEDLPPVFDTASGERRRRPTRTGNEREPRAEEQDVQDTKSHSRKIGTAATEP